MAGFFVLYNVMYGSLLFPAGFGNQKAQVGILPSRLIIMGSYKGSICDFDSHNGGSIPSHITLIVAYC